MKKSHILLAALAIVSMSCTKEISESKFELSSYAVIEPGVEINEIEDVFVITAFEGQGIEEIID